jgi:flavin reductase (DIM6/NTAB) family NADH-FMN oxidoreductase RutF
MSGPSMPIAPDLFRLVLGHFPSGVAVVTAVSRDGHPVGLVVSSFTSVSLNPPLVAFFPAVTSKSWPEIEASGSFCINILSAEQESYSRQFGRSGGDKFAGLSWFASPSGAPVLEGSLAWIDCDVSRVDEVGDHFVVYGAVKDLQLQSGSAPLVYFRGGYGGFESASLVAGDPNGDLVVPLRLVDLGRPLLEAFAERSNTQVAVNALVGGQTVVLAVAGATAEDRASSTFIGQRVRAVAPIGASFMAFEPAQRVAAWMASAPADQAENLRARLEAIRRHGMAFSLEGGGIKDWQDAMSAPTEDVHEREQALMTRVMQSFHPQVEAPDAPRVRNLHVPVLTPDGRAGLFLNVGGFPPLDEHGLAQLVADVKGVASQISELAARS